MIAGADSTRVLCHLWRRVGVDSTKVLCHLRHRANVDSTKVLCYLFHRAPAWFQRWHRASALSLLLIVSLVAGCAPAVAPPVVTAPRYPDYIFPVLVPPDPKQADLFAQHDTAWRRFQSGELDRAERDFQEVLKRSPQFYPSETAIGYVQLARKNYNPALERFDRVLQTRRDYVPALVGRGEALLAQSRDLDALPSFEAALTLDPGLVEIRRRVEVLRARAAQENVAAARRAAQANRFDEAAQLYEKALAASPDSAFLVRDLADVEARQGKVDQALTRYRRALELEPSDAVSRIRIAELLDARGDLEGAMKLYTDANDLEPSPELNRRMSALEARLAYLRLPAEYRALPDAPAITRGDLASLIGIRLATLISSAPAQPALITDVRDHWAASWILSTAGAGIMEPYENHTFQPSNPVRRGDLAQAVSRMLKIIAAGRPQLLRDWQSRQQKMSDVGVSNLRYADASLAAAAGILPLTEGGMFQLSRPVTGAEAIEAITRIEQLHTSAVSK